MSLLSLSTSPASSSWPPLPSTCNRSTRCFNAARHRTARTFCAPTYRLPCDCPPRSSVRSASSGMAAASIVGPSPSQRRTSNGEALLFRFKTQTDVRNVARLFGGPLSPSFYHAYYHHCASCCLVVSAGRLSPLPGGHADSCVPGLLLVLALCPSHPAACTFSRRQRHLPRPFFSLSLFLFLSLPPPFSTVAFPMLLLPPLCPPRHRWPHYNAYQWEIIWV